MVTGRFVVLTVAGLCYFLGMGVGLAVLPRWVEDELGGSGLAVGIVTGGMGISAALLRPLIGPIGDRRGRRFLFQWGCAFAGAGLLVLVVAESVPVVLAGRLISGLGEAGAFVGAAAAIQDIVPPNRRGEAASYFSVAIYGGLAVGPLLGEWVNEQYGTDQVWWLGAAFCAAGLVLGRVAPAVANPAAQRPRRFLHPAAVRPGLTLFLGLMGYMGFVAFIAIHAEDIGVAAVGAPFAVLAAVTLSLRIAGSRLFDILGPVRSAGIAMAASAVGLLVLGLWRAPAGVFVGTTVLAVGQTFLFPGLFAATVERAPETERSHAVASFSFFFDSATAVGGMVMGAVVALSDEPTAFLVGGGICVVTLLSLRALLGPVMVERAALAETVTP